MYCLQCNKQLENYQKKYCSKYCRERYWFLHNKERVAVLSKRYNDKRIVLCRYCNNPISKENRGCGIMYCSDICRLKIRKQRSKISFKDQTNIYTGLKEKCGCCNPLCRYNKLGCALDFHHIDPSLKDTRITHKDWFNKTKEIEKCLLLCKNCHYEAHHYMRHNLEKYKEFMDSCQEIRIMMLSIFQKDK